MTGCGFHHAVDGTTPVQIDSQVAVPWSDIASASFPARRCGDFSPSACPGQFRTAVAPVGLRGQPVPYDPNNYVPTKVVKTCPAGPIFRCIMRTQLLCALALLCG